MAYPPKYDRSKILSLIREGKTDEEVRKVVGCSTSLVQQYRYLQRVVERMVMRGYSDKEINFRTGIPVLKISELRESLELSESEAIDYEEIDRRALCYRLLCNGYTIDAVVDETGFQRAEVHRFKKDMPNWWRKESRRAEEG